MPSALEDVPASHDSHSDDPLVGATMPAEHSLHAEAALPEYRPGPHSPHTVRSVFDFLPAVQISQLDTPLVRATVPAAQLSHSAAALSEVFPFLQSVHWAAPLPLYSPPLHSLQK